MPYVKITQAKPLVQLALFLVPEAGLEPAQYFYRGILSPLRQKFGNKMPAQSSSFYPKLLKK